MIWDQYDMNDTEFVWTISSRCSDWECFGFELMVFLRYSIDICRLASLRIARHGD